MIRFMKKEDKKKVMDIIHSTGMFTDAEIVVAEELIDRFLDVPEQKDYQVVVIEDGRHNVVGYLCYGPTDLTEGVYDIYWTAVSPECQGEGFGRAMFDWLENKIGAENGRMIIIETSSQPKYQPTRQFYLNSDCREVARIPDFYKPGDDRVIYIKRLN